MKSMQGMMAHTQLQTIPRTRLLLDMDMVRLALDTEHTAVGTMLLIIGMGPDMEMGNRAWTALVQLVQLVLDVVHPSLDVLWLRLQMCKQILEVAKKPALRTVAKLVSCRTTPEACKTQVLFA